MKWELINPSDPYCVEADSFKVAACAALIVGKGAYSLEPIDGAVGELPIFLLGGSEKWLIGEFGSMGEFSNFIAHHKPEIIAALRTITIDDDERSSLNNIGGKAANIADIIEADIKNEQREVG
jgi:hypothetical protein